MLSDGHCCKNGRGYIMRPSEQHPPAHDLSLASIRLATACRPLAATAPRPALFWQGKYRQNRLRPPLGRHTAVRTSNGRVPTLRAMPLLPPVRPKQPPRLLRTHPRNTRRRNRRPQTAANQNRCRTRPDRTHPADLRARRQTRRPHSSGRKHEHPGSQRPAENTGRTARRCRLPAGFPRPRPPADHHQKPLPPNGAFRPRPANRTGIRPPTTPGPRRRTAGLPQRRAAL